MRINRMAILGKQSTGFRVDGVGFWMEGREGWMSGIFKNGWFSMDWKRFCAFKSDLGSTVPDETKLTTQAAADFLNVSRAHLVKLLEEGVIPYKEIGRHRRILLEDLVAYSKDMKQKRKEALEELARLGQQYNM